MSPPSIPLDPEADYAREERVRGAAMELYDALRPFVDAYKKAADPVGDSDLYDEQPRSVHVTLGDCRKAERAMRKAEGR